MECSVLKSINSNKSLYKNARLIKKKTQKRTNSHNNLNMEDECLNFLRCAIFVTSFDVYCCGCIVFQDGVYDMREFY